MLFFGCKKEQKQPTNNTGLSVSERTEWEILRLADPQTGEIPKNIRQRELAFAKMLPKDNEIFTKRTSDWKQIGPYNIGGRTRAAAIDVTNDNIILAGGVSGGMWRSEDQGKSWSKTSANNHHHSVTCLTQDKRAGKENIWYYGSGEGRGNSATKLFSADYLGDGVYKSIDGGKSWFPLTATQSNSPHSKEPWDIMWNITTDHSVDSADVVYAAITGRVMRSNDGGLTWEIAVGSSTGFLATYTDIMITPKGVKYATLSSEGAVNGIFRSEDGVNWTDITPAGFSNVYSRIVSAADPLNDNKIYFLANVVDGGKRSDPNNKDSERNSLWKYTYKSGDGSGINGTWVDLSVNIPAGTNFRTRFQSQGSYDMVIAIKPDDPNVIFIAGTNMYRSADAFTSSNNITHIGGYNPWESSTFEYRYPENHPDYHVIDFLGGNPNYCFTANDGGCYLTKNIMADTVVWEDLNRGYYTTQFYHLAIDHNTVGSQIIAGGMQDNSTAWTNTDDPTFKWTIPSSGDGSFAAIGNGGKDYYFSSQLGRTYKMTLDQNGNRTAYRRIDPDNGGPYLFVNPFILDPADNNVMYMTSNYSVYRHQHLDSIALDSTNSKLKTHWEQLITNNDNNRVHALKASRKNPKHRLYVGTINREVYILDSANTNSPNFKKITQKLGTGTFVSDIAVHPEDGNKAIVVYSNYNAYSLYYTDDAGDTWQKIAGNLEAELPDGFPLTLKGLGDGPSIRAAAFLPIGNEMVYLIGTSTGLYATKKLEGDSTVWVQQAANIIGNVVVDMIDVRPEDGFVAVATHGRGVFSNFITNINEITGIDDIRAKRQENSDLSIFPNPASGQINFYTTEKIISARVLDLQGRSVLQLNPNSNFNSINISALPNGVYSVYLQTQNKPLVGKFVVSK